MPPRTATAIIWLIAIAWAATAPPTVVAVTLIGAHIFGIYLQFIICILSIFKTFGFYLFLIYVLF
ncbi:hypothetical protein CW714_03225 [Methanophagales archaeon]|nr:MAG: hypothetical protein CW714_03225 [Methanophagales archaeon]